MNKHPHEEVIVAYYRGEQIQLCNLDGQWEDIPKYGTGIVFQHPPKFTPDRLYRIKPQPPKLHTVELTQGEVEALWLLTGAVAGCPRETARCYTNSANAKIGKHIPRERQTQLVDWATQNLRGMLSFAEIPK